MIWFFTESGEHIGPSVYQRRTKLIYRWHCNPCQCACMFSPTQTLFSLLLHLDIYLYINITAKVQMKIYKLTDIPYTHSKLFNYFYTLN